MDKDPFKLNTNCTDGDYLSSHDFSFFETMYVMGLKLKIFVFSLNNFLSIFIHPITVLLD